MRPIRESGEATAAPTRPSAPWALSGPARSFPSSAGAARPDAHAGPRASRCLAGNSRAHLGRPRAGTARPASPLVRVRPLAAAGSRAKPRQTWGTAWVLSGGTRCARVRQCARGATGVCVRLSRGWRGLAGRVGLSRRGTLLVQDFGWDAPGIFALPARPPDLALALGARSRSAGAVRPPAGRPFSDLKARTSHCLSRPPSSSTLAADPGEETQSIPAPARAGHPAPRPGTSPRCSPRAQLRRRKPRRGARPPARPACGPRHSQVAAAGQDEKELRAVHGEQRAARRQQEHGGPALPAGPRRPRGQSAGAGWGRGLRGPPQDRAAEPGARDPSARAPAQRSPVPRLQGLASRRGWGCGAR